MDRELEELLASHRDRIAYPDMADSASKARARIENADRPALVGSALEPAPLDGWDDEGPETANAPHPITRIDQRAPGKLRQALSLAAAALALFIVGGFLIAVLPDVIDGDGQPVTAVLGPDTTGYEFAGTIGGSMIPNEPVDVAVDSQGNIYAADIATRSVHKFDSKGAYLASWTADDAEVGPFIRPWSLAIEGDTVYVLDQQQAAIYRLDTNGNVLGSWRTGDQTDPASLLSGIDVNQHGHVYVTNSNAGTIAIFESDGTPIADIQVAADPNSGGDRPYDIAVAADGTMYVTGFDGEAINVYDTTGAQIASWSDISLDSNVGGGMFGVTLAPTGELYVNSERSIARIGQDGSTLETWAIEGRIGTSYLPPSYIAVDSQGTLYVPDTLNQRIVILLQNGDVAREIKDTRPARFSTPGGIKVDDEGSVYIPDSGAQRVTKLAPDGTVLDTWEWEADAAIRLDRFSGDVALTEDHLYILDGHKPSIVKLTWSGEKVHEWTGSPMGEDMWYRPLGIYADTAGNVYLMNQGQSILKYNPEDEFLEQWHQTATGVERQNPLSMHIKDDTVYVAFSGGTMPGIWTLDLDGNPMERIVEFSLNDDGFPDTFVNSLAVAPSGDIFTVDPSTRTARWYTPAGELKAEWELDVGVDDAFTFVNIAVSDTGTVYVSDGDTRQILVYEPVS